MAKKYIDAELLRKKIEDLKVVHIGHAAITKETNAVDGLDAVLQVIDSLQQEQPAKRGYKDCNGCEYNRLLKDQIGWQFRGCFGGDYKGKPIAEIELCPLKVAQQEQPSDYKIDEGLTGFAQVCELLDGMENRYSNIGLIDGRIIGEQNDGKK